MICPCCQKEMEKGLIILGGREPLKWIHESKDKGEFINMFQKGIKLTRSWISNQTEAYYCKNCKKVLMDVKDKLVTE